MFMQVSPIPQRQIVQEMNAWIAFDDLRSMSSLGLPGHPPS